MRRGAKGSVKSRFDRRAMQRQGQRHDVPVMATALTAAAAMGLMFAALGRAA